MRKSRHRVQPAVHEHLHLNDGHRVRDGAREIVRSYFLVHEQLLKELVVLDSAKAGRIEKAYPVGDQRKQRHVESIRFWPEKHWAGLRYPTHAAHAVQVSIRGRGAKVVVNDALWKERRSVKGDWGGQTTC